MVVFLNQGFVGKSSKKHVVFSKSYEIGHNVATILA